MSEDYQEEYCEYGDGDENFPKEKEPLRKIEPPFITLTDDEIEKAVKEAFPYYKYPDGPREYQEEYCVRILKAFRDKRFVIVCAPTGSGKAQPLHSLIKVPNGWKRMGDMCVGDSVSVPDGGTASVTGVFPQGVKDVYKITFEDGRSCECCGDHLWKVYNNDWVNKHKVISTKDIIAYLGKSKVVRLYTDLGKSYGEAKDLPLDPYMLGCLLGDGSFRGNSVDITNVDVDLLKILTSKLEKGYCLKKLRYSKYNYKLCRLDSYREDDHFFKKKGVFHQHYHKVLNDMNLLGKHSYEKFIPDIYKEASYEQRLEIIRGLMDTDGTVSKSCVSFSTSSYQLALDMQYLIRSVGGLCKISVRNPYYKYKGEKKDGRPNYILNIRHGNGEDLFNVSRKKEKAKRSLKVSLKSKIKYVELIGSEQCQCIMVDDLNHLYVTNNFVVTHNSCLSYVVSSVMNKYGKGGAGKSFITVPYKTLQDQYVFDFHKEIVHMKGISNYLCAESESHNHCGIASCRLPSYNGKLIRKHMLICPYSKAKVAAQESTITLFNTSAFLCFFNYTSSFNWRRLAVVDECHTLDNNLKSFITFSFSFDKLYKLGIKDVPEYENPEEYYDWMLNLKDITFDALKQLLAKAESERQKTGVEELKLLLTEDEMKLYKIASTYYEKACGYLSIENIKDSYVVSRAGFGKANKIIEFKPVYITRNDMNRYLFNHADCFLFLSATIYKKTFCRDLGLEDDEVDYFEIPSTFPEPKKRRPFIVDNGVGALNNKNLEENLPIMLKRIEELAQYYKDYKGIIHTHTYKIADFILKYGSTDLRKRLISHKGGVENPYGISREEALAMHCERKDATILISPSMYEGVDLKDGLARWQAICKIPFASLIDPQVKKRMELDPEWYQWETIKKLIQAYGRVTRSKTDWGYTFCLDRTFLMLYRRYSFMFNVWMKQAVIVKGK